MKMRQTQPTDVVLLLGVGRKRKTEIIIVIGVMDGEATASVTCCQR